MAKKHSGQAVMEAMIRFLGNLSGICRQIRNEMAEKRTLRNASNTTTMNAAGRTAAPLFCCRMPVGVRVVQFRMGHGRE